MTQWTITELVEYLLRLAPSHFGRGIRKASTDDIRRLEAASGRAVVGCHRDFLLAMGNSEFGALDPFLNGRAFAIDDLIAGYPDLVKFGFSLDEDVALFSAPESYAEFEFIRTERPPGQRQYLGIVDFETGAFRREGTKDLPEYLFKFAFAFRVGQHQHIRHFQPRGERGPQRASVAHQALTHRGLRSVFSFSDQTTCLEGDQCAATIHADASGTLSSDDRVALLDLCGAMEDLADMKIQPGAGLESPKE